MNEPKLCVGDIVRSRAGRDGGRYFVVTAVEEESYVRICDGDLRKLDRPKRKKRMHLVVCPHMENMQVLAEEKPVCDADIRKHLQKQEAQFVQTGCH